MNTKHKRLPPPAAWPAALCAFALLLSACSTASKGLESSWGVKAGKPGTLAESPPLIRALRFGDWQRAASLIAQGVGKGERIPRTPDGTPVELAVTAGKNDLLRSLVEAGWISPSEGEEALIRAAEIGNREAAEYLIGKGYTVGSSPAAVRRAMGTGKGAVYELFLRAPHPKYRIDGTPASVFNEGTALPRSLLGNVAAVGETRLVKPVLDAGGTLEIKTPSFRGYEKVRPLWIALAAGRTETALALLDAGADPEASDQVHKYSPLMVACITGDEAAAARLIREGADVNRKSAAKYISDSAFNSFTGSLSMTITGLEQRTPLILAAENRHSGMVRLLLAAGADPSLENDAGWSALDAARVNRDAKTCGMLLAAGAKENPLVTAVCAGDAAALYPLLPGLDDYLGTKFRPVYPLQLAVRWHAVTGSKAVLDVLIEAKDRLSPIDVERALRAAAKEDEELLLYLYSKDLLLKTDAYDSGFETLRSLVRKGETKGFQAAWQTAGRDLSKNRINLLLQEAALKGNLELTGFLLDRGADPDAYWFMDRLSMLGKAATAGNLDLVKLLAERGSQINPKLSKIGWVVSPWISPLMAAAEAGHAPVVRYLLDKGAAVDETGFEGPTALGYAALNGRTECARILLERGASPDLRMARLQPDSITTLEHRHETALMMAARQGSPETVGLLLKNGADPRLTDWIGDDPLLMAFEAGNREAEALVAKALGGRYPQ